MSGRTVHFDEPLGLYHGGIFRLSPDDDAVATLAHHLDVGMVALEAGTGVQVADIEPVPGAPVDVFRTFDVDTGDLIVLWRVACRQRGERIQ